MSRKELAVLNRAKSDAHLNEPKIAALIIQLKAVNVALRISKTKLDN